MEMNRFFKGVGIGVLLAIPAWGVLFCVVALIRNLVA